jgi:hypothetical protein
MGSLSPPTIWAPVYECTPVLVVTGYVPGAEVKIYAAPPSGAPVKVGGGVSFAPGGQVFGVPSANMTKDTVVSATQTLAGDTSPTSPPVYVQAALGSVQPPLLVPPLFECARCMRAHGMMPGAEARIRDGSSVIGTATAAWVTVDVSVPALQAGHPIRARQIYCGDSTASSEKLAVIPVLREPPLTLPKPKIREPIYACEPFVVVEGCVPGCRVELVTGGVFVAGGCAAGTEIALWVPGGLVEGTIFRASQLLCEGGETPLKSPLSSTEVVKPASEMPKPAIMPSLWAGATTVAVGMTKAGQLVTLEADGDPIGKGGAGGGLTILNVDPPLEVGQQVTAKVELCGVIKTSSPLPVGAYPYDVEAPEVAGPLWACAPTVMVKKCVPGATVRVEAKKGTQTVLLGIAHAFGSSVVVGVVPLLQKGWKVRAKQQVGATWSVASSPAEEVKSFGTLKAPRLRGPLYECARCVAVTSVVPGAHVDIERDGTWIGGVFAAASTVDVPVYPGLTKGNIRARQTLCGQASGLSTALPVTAPPELPAPLIVAAYVGQTSVTVTDVVPGATVYIKEGTGSTLLGHACVTESPATVALGVPLFTGASVWAEQLLCDWSAASWPIAPAPSPGWPLGPGPFKAGSRVVTDIPVGADVTFLGSTSGQDGMEFTFPRPAQNVGIVFYPATVDGDGAPVAAGGPFPLIVFGHGKRFPFPVFYGGTVCAGAPTDITQDFRQFFGILAHVASWGFVIVSPDVFWLTNAGEDDRALVLRDAISYMLAENTRAGSPFQSQIDGNNLGVGGHSSSGLAAILLSISGTLAIKALGLVAPAAAGLDFTGFAPNPPVLVVHGTKEPPGGGGPGVGNGPLNVYAAAGPNKYLVTIGGANHFGYTDELCLVADGEATISQADQQKIARAYVTAFFRRYLQGALEVDDYLVGVKPVEELEGFDVTVEAQL